MKMKEVLKESNYILYHKTYTDAVSEFLKYIEKSGYTYDKDEVADAIGINSVRPSEGRTTKVSIPIYKNGKIQRKYAHMQVYGNRTNYELNCYIS